ncbi:MAG: type II toxin-antitoxin system VapC family toxin [Kiloniellales bacterium]
MILLDTNVISALMQRQPDPVVVGWLDGLPVDSVWLTSVSVFEVRFGIELLTAGRRRQQLEEAFAKALEEDFEGRVLPFDQTAAQAAAEIAAVQRRAGRAIEFRDVQIAGITLARKALLATRNIKHFEGFGLTLVDPWSA